MKTIQHFERGGHAHWVGDGFPVRTIFSPQSLGQRISPFLLLDYAGPAQFPPADRPRGVEQHPHRGFETVTIVYQGELEHRDSAGNSGRIGPDDVQWMTAAAGILHEEMHAREFTRGGGTLEMVQLWVNLPARFKMSAPHYQTLLDRDIPVVALPENGGTLRVIAGEHAGMKGPARTFTPINVWDLRLASGGRVDLQLPEGHTTALFVLNGKINVNGTEWAGAADLALFNRAGHEIVLQAEENSTALLLSGEPINEPVASYGPFVMNTQEEIRQAVADFQSGRFGQMPA